ncbi:ribonuclease III [Spiroplasma endosymbiont of Othius punctulatus]|uniref:ribonuclease III n=1 Tax=Spiroplasma endosymbiont of Othius punctulatus TaxID=3066289 RepID=UPI0030CCFD5E
MDSIKTLKELMASLGIEIKDMDLYDEALTHNSWANETGNSKTYQRLEFLGDAILQMKVSEYLFGNFVTFNEGSLTKYRSAMVREESLSFVAKNLDLGKYIKLGIGEINSKGHEKASMLCDVFESLTAAIYLDQGLEKVNSWLEQTLFKVDNVTHFIEQTHDYKSELQELIQLDNRNELEYKVIDKVTNDYNQTTFKVAVMIGSKIYGTGEGQNKKAAEQLAAKSAISKMKKG